MLCLAETAPVGKVKRSLIFEVLEDELLGNIFGLSLRYSNLLADFRDYLKRLFKKSLNLK